jgi:hypothetical protein
MMIMKHQKKEKTRMTMPKFMACVFEHTGQMSEDMHDLIEKMALYKGRHRTVEERNRGEAPKKVSAKFRLRARQMVLTVNAKGWARQLESTKHMPREEWLPEHGFQGGGEWSDTGGTKAKLVDIETDRLKMDQLNTAGWTANAFGIRAGSQGAGGMWGWRQEGQGWVVRSPLVHKPTQQRHVQHNGGRANWGPAQLRGE